MFFVENQAVAHAIGLLQMLGDHRVDIFKIFAQIAVYGLVCQVDGAFELGHFHINPIFLLGRIRVGGDERVLRALETVFFNRVDFHVGLFRQVNAEIAARLGQIVVAVATRGGDEDYGQGHKQYGQFILHHTQLSLP